MKQRVKIYTLATCDSCRRATKWLRAQAVEFDEVAIRDTPPTARELATVLAACDGELRRLFNTSGKDYRDQKLGDRLPSLTKAEAFALLSENGNLVKRPFVVGPDVGLVGFDEATWGAAFSRG